jgi:hypothetical protein
MYKIKRKGGKQNRVREESASINEAKRWKAQTRALKSA